MRNICVPGATTVYLDALAFSHSRTQLFWTKETMSEPLVRASPTGRQIAFVKDTSLSLQDIQTNHVQLRDIGPTFNATKTAGLRWSADGKRLLLFRDGAVKVENVKPPGTIADLDNGSGGIGRIVKAEFLHSDAILVIWEFGKIKVWDLETGKHTDLADIKTSCDGQTRQLRPGSLPGSSSALLAMLSRAGADDHLILYFISSQKPVTSIKLPTLDAQSLSWSPDGRWLAISDVPSATPGLFIFTPDGHLFRSYPQACEGEDGLGVKKFTWSQDGKLLALAKYDGTIELLNTKTFSLLATIQHSTTINRPSLEQHAPPSVWQEASSAANVRSYTIAPLPFSPPLSKAKPSTEPSEIGVAEQSFSVDSRYLASVDTRMLNTVWYWDTVTWALRAVLIQHSNVRRLAWHPTRPDISLLDCAEDIAHIFDPSKPSEPPLVMATGLRPKASLSWVHTPLPAKLVILGSERLKFELIYPEGREDGHDMASNIDDRNEHSFDESAEGEDSLLDFLSGRKPLPPKTEPSYTEMVDMNAEAARQEFDGQLDDTFREKRKAKDVERDPLDDSDIF